MPSASGRPRCASVVTLQPGNIAGRYGRVPSASESPIISSGRPAPLAGIGSGSGAAPAPGAAGSGCASDSLLIRAASSSAERPAARLCDFAVRFGLAARARRGFLAAGGSSSTSTRSRSAGAEPAAPTTT